MKDEEQKLILYLQKHPLATNAEIASAIGKTPPTVKRWLDRLMTGVDRAIISVSGILNPQRVGMEMHSYVIELQGKNSPKTFEVLKRLGDVHPYTSYQNRIFGSQNGMLMQFTLPSGTSPYMDEMFDELIETTSINRVTHYWQADYSVESFPELSKYRGGYWDFKFSEWLDSTPQNGEVMNADHTSVLDKMSLVDFALIRELMINSRRKQVDIVNDIKSSPLYSEEIKNQLTQRKVSRRIEFINELKIISSYRLLYNRARFKLFNHLFFSGYMSDENRSRVQAAMSNLPFRSSFSYFSSDQRFVWWINLPPEQSSDAMNTIFSISREMQMAILDNNPQHLIFYPLWHGNFIDSEKRWRDSREYIVDTVMQDLNR